MVVNGLTEIFVRKIRKVDSFCTVMDNKENYKKVTLSYETKIKLKVACEVYCLFLWLADT